MAKEISGKQRETVAKWIRDMLPKKCVNCGSTTGLQYHHIVPAIYGGNDVPSNIAVLCTVCHQKVHYGKSSTTDHGDCVRKGQLRAKARGVKLGRRPANNESVMRLIAEKSTQFNNIEDENFKPYTEHEIMDMAGIKPTCYSKYKRMLLDAIRADKWPYDWPKPKVVNSRPLYDHCVKDMRGAL